MTSAVYNYDKIDFLSTLTEKELLSIEGVSDYFNFYGKFTFHRIWNKNFNHNFKTIITIVSPTFQFLNWFCNHDAFKNTIITYIEICEDTLLDDEIDAVILSNEIIASLTMNHTSHHFCYDNSEKLGELKDGFIGDRTGYFGSNMFRFVVYPRISKIAETFCVHCEFRLRGNDNIFKRMGIRFAFELLSFDVQLFYHSYAIKYFRYYKIDYTKVGKFFCNLTRKKNLTKSQLRRAQLTGQIFLSATGVDSPAKLKRYLKDEAIKIKARKGKLTREEERVLKARPSYFLIPIADTIVS